MSRPERVIRDRRGMALALAVFALVIIGGLVASNFFVALLEQQSGRNVRLAGEAAGIAEGELWEVTPEVSAASLLGLPIGGNLEISSGLIRPGLSVQQKVDRLADNLFLVQSRAIRTDGAGNPLAARSVGLLAHLVPDSLSGTQILRPIDQRAWVQLY